VIEPADPAVARTLILEYATATGVDLSFQNFQHEIDHLAEFYEAMFVATEDGVPAGCVALRRMDEQTCEMKRLYVRPEFRGRDLGRALAEHVIEDAKRRGFARMRLDTLPTMTSAFELYRSLGFVEIAPYRFNPVEGSRYMELALGPLPYNPRP
jgi:ribosomal protein S18 acetylase RimI-like enzyme